MPRRPGDPELVFDNDSQPTQDGLAVIDGVLLFVGETVGDVEGLIERVRNRYDKDLSRDLQRHNRGRILPKEDIGSGHE